MLRCVAYSNISQSTKQSTCAGIISPTTEIQPPESSGCTVVHNGITQWFGAEKAELKIQEILYGRENNFGLCVSSQWSRSNVLVPAEAEEDYSYLQQSKLWCYPFQEKLLTSV